MSAERWRSGWAIRVRWPRSARWPTRAIRVSLSGPGRRLEQDPAAAAERDAPQLLLAQGLDRGLRHLASLQDLHCQSLIAERPVELLDPAGELLDPHIVVVADVRRRADQLDPVVHRLARQAQAVGDVERAVVDAGEDVAVQIDHKRSASSRAVGAGANALSGRARGHGTTMIGMIQHLLPLGWREQLASTHG